MLYSLLEQHKDGSWWYHPGFTFDTPEEVEQCFREHFPNDKRPHMVFEHEEPMFQEFSTSSYDLKAFDFGGLIHWPKRLEGTLRGRRNQCEACHNEGFDCKVNTPEELGKIQKKIY